MICSSFKSNKTKIKLQSESNFYREKLDFSWTYTGLLLELYEEHTKRCDIRFRNRQFNVRNWTVLRCALPYDHLPI